jgi:hypothetical protein
MEITEMKLAEAIRLLKAFCKATGPADAYGWVYDEMRRMTWKEREEAQKFIRDTAVSDREQTTNQT